MRTIYRNQGTPAQLPGAGGPWPRWSLLQVGGALGAEASGGSGRRLLVHGGVSLAGPPLSRSLSRLSTTVLRWSAGWSSPSPGMECSPGGGNIDDEVINTWALNSRSLSSQVLEERRWWGLVWFSQERQSGTKTLKTLARISQ